MAEGRNVSNTGVCRSFANNGQCRQGINCPFVHQNSSRRTCRFHQQGRCRYGRFCRFSHMTPRGSDDSEESDSESPLTLLGILNRQERDNRVGFSERGSWRRQESDSRAESPPDRGSERGSWRHLLPRGSHHVGQPKPGPSTATPTTSSFGGGTSGGGTSQTNVFRKTKPNTGNAQQSTSSSVPLSSTDVQSKGVPLRKQTHSSDSGLGDECCALPHPPNEWVQAPEFVPNRKERKIPDSKVGTKSYAEVLHQNTKAGPAERSAPRDAKLCPFAEAGECKQGDQCGFLHGSICELCNKACLHPHDPEQRKKHNTECVKQHEKDMELSFAVARSKDKMCGICFEVVMEKTHREQRFGILPNCNHCFCLSCIRTWRQAKQFENNITRACPECRVTSDFVCPSMYWVDTKEDKEKLIADYKEALSTKDCKYFKKGEGKCPFGNKCFYLHVLPDGSKVDVGPPSRQRRRNAEGEFDYLQHIILWDFLEERGDGHILYFDELDHSFFSDSDFSDSDFEFIL